MRCIPVTCGRDFEVGGGTTSLQAHVFAGPVWRVENPVTSREFDWHGASSLKCM